MTMAIHSKMRHWRRCERRWEMAFVIGPVPPPGVAEVPTCPTCERGEIVPLFSVVCESSLLFKPASLVHPNFSPICSLRVSLRVSLRYLQCCRLLIHRNSLLDHCLRRKALCNR